MSDWQCKLDLTDVWEKAKNDEIPTHKLAEIIAERLRKLACPNNETYDERFVIADEFETISTDPDLTKYEFDYVMDMLYDWGDISLGFGKRVCWIATLF